MREKKYVARPTPQQLAWQEMELGVLIHYCLETFGAPLAALSPPELKDGRCSLSLPDGTAVSYAVLMEDIAEGQRIRGFRLLADGKPVCESRCVGHKRIVPLQGLLAKELTLEITAAAGTPVLRDFSAY